MIAERNAEAIPTPVLAQCPMTCDLAETVACWVRRERELRADLAAARGHADEEVLAADLRAAKRQIDALIGHGAALAKMRRILGVEGRAS